MENTLMSLILYKQVNEPITTINASNHSSADSTSNSIDNNSLVLANGSIILRDPRSNTLVLHNNVSDKITLLQSIFHDLEYTCPTCGHPLKDKVEYENLKIRNNTNSTNMKVRDNLYSASTNNNNNNNTTNNNDDNNIDFDNSASQRFIHENYFRLLNKGLLADKSNILPASTSSQSSSSFSSSFSSSPSPLDHIPASLFTQGYYKTFFKKLALLGIGARGSVFKVQHVLLNSINLGVYALKKIPIGNNLDWLAKGMSEVQLLSKITNNHPNLISYNHVWLEMDNSNGIIQSDENAINKSENIFLGDHQVRDSTAENPGYPKVPCIFILQQYCAGGNLEDCLKRNVWNIENEFDSREERKRKFKNMRMKRRLSNNGSSVAIFNEGLSTSNIISILKDIACGLHKLHELNIIHRDLKPSNCLLTKKYEAGDLKFPTIVISDFGESQIEGQLRTATGATGTIEFTAPEVLIDKNTNSSTTKSIKTIANNTNNINRYCEFTFKSDMYSLGMVGYFLIFRELPWEKIPTMSELKVRIRSYVFSSKKMRENYHFAPEIDPRLFKLLENLLSHDPETRFSTDQVLIFLKSIESIKGETENTKNETEHMRANSISKEMENELLSDEFLDDNDDINTNHHDNGKSNDSISHVNINASMEENKPKKFQHKLLAFLVNSMLCFILFFKEDDRFPFQEEVRYGLILMLGLTWNSIYFARIFHALLIIGILLVTLL